MSGNMSFINNSGSVTGPTLPSINGNERNATAGADASRLNSSLIGGRSSLSFSEVGSPLSSLREDENEGRERFSEDYQDKDVWGTRIILSALEEITFSEASFPKLSPQLKHAFQKFLLAVNAAASNANPFVETPKAAADGSSMAAGNNSTLVEEGSKLLGTSMEIPREVLETLESIPTETKIVLRSLISNYVRNLPLKIIETWKPILEADGMVLPLASSKSKLVAPKKRSGSLSLEDYDLEGCLQMILEKMQSVQKETLELDLKIRDLMKSRDEQLFKYERDIKTLNQINLAILQEKAAMEDPEFVSSYMDILELENKVLEEQLRLEQLKLEADNSTEEEQKERKELYNKIKALYDQMEAETLEMEAKIAQYKSLGPEYLNVLEEYKTVEEEISTKEWVKEQLVNGPQDDSLFDDSM